MEFEEMQKVWNEQKGETMYAIDESALHNRIKSKKRAASSRVNKVEIGLMIINSICSITLFVDGLDDPHNWDFFSSAMMLVTVIYIVYTRTKRKKAENMYDRSMLGELDHAIANTDSLIHISRLMIYGYLIPFSLFFIVKMIVLEASLEKWLTIFGLYSLAFLMITWERKSMHIPRKKHLKMLRDKLVKE